MTTGVSFTNTTSDDRAAKEKAEMYMRIYQYAAEDFASIPDLNAFAKDVIAWANSVEQRLEELTAKLEAHTHEITPHTHDIPDHTHTLVPHTHTSSAPGSPTSPELGPITVLANGPKKCINSVNAGVQTKEPLNATELRWPVRQVPTEPQNMTGAQSNFSGNKIVMGTGQLSSSDQTDIHKRRSLVIPILNTPDVPPLLTT